MLIRPGDRSQRHRLSNGFRTIAIAAFHILTVAATMQWESLNANSFQIMSVRAPK